MKLLIASDLHGSAYYTKLLMDAFEREKADRLILLGDLLYHGPRNDLPKDYNPKAVIEMLNTKANQIMAVRGNCDAFVDDMVLNFHLQCDFGCLIYQNRLIYLSHGHLENSSNLAPKDILLQGHTHIPCWKNFGQENYLLNPGSVSIPKEGSAHSYMILEEEGIFWKNLEGDCFHSLKV
jgi:hypothetical protein